MQSSPNYNENLAIHKPQLEKVVPWKEIEAQYQQLITDGWQLKPMLSLIQFIRSSGYGERLFGFTYFYERLVVTIYNPIERDREALHIDFDRNTKRWRFAHLPKPFEPVEMERYYPEEEGIIKFCKYIELLKW